LPVTLSIEIGPFAAESKYANKAPVVVSVVFKLVETRVTTVIENEKVEPMVTGVVNVPLVSSWLKDEKIWSRMVNATLPSSPDLTPSTETKVLNITHVLLVKLRVKVQDRIAEEVKFQSKFFAIPMLLRAYSGQQ